jgi:hypothetical protein
LLLDNETSENETDKENQLYPNLAELKKSAKAQQKHKRLQEQTIREHDMEKLYPNLNNLSEMKYDLAHKEIQFEMDSKEHLKLTSNTFNVETHVEELQPIDELQHPFLSSHNRISMIPRVGPHKGLMDAFFNEDNEDFFSNFGDETANQGKKFIF